MGEAHAESDRLHKIMGRLRNQKDEVNQEQIDLGTKTTAALLAGQDVSCLLYSKLLNEKFLESIDIAMPEIQRQIAELRPARRQEDLVRMQAEKEELTEKMQLQIDVITAAKCHHAECGGDGKLDPEKEQRAKEAGLELDRLRLKFFQLNEEIRLQERP